MDDVRIGIDFGGTKTEIIALDAYNGKELYRQRIPTSRVGYNTTLQAIQYLVKGCEETLNRKGTVGIAIPGSISSVHNTVKNCNAIWVNGRPLRDDLSKLLEREVLVENDANCFAVSEAVDGAAAGKKSVFGVIIGTGCGGGLVMDGKVVSGLNGMGGEWGHNPLPAPRVYMEPATAAAMTKKFDDNINTYQGKNIYPNKSGVPEYFTIDPDWNEVPGDKCYCGRRSCLEYWIAGTGFKSDYSRVTGENLSTHDIIANMNNGEPRAIAAFDRYVDRLARALGTVINIFDPHAIVLGGGMSNVKQLYERVPAIWDRYLFTDICDTPLLPPMHGDSSGVRGAAWLWGKEPS